MEELSCAAQPPPARPKRGTFSRSYGRTVRHKTIQAFELYRKESYVPGLSCGGDAATLGGGVGSRKWDRGFWGEIIVTWEASPKTLGKVRNVEEKEKSGMVREPPKPRKARETGVRTVARTHLSISRN